MRQKGFAPILIVIILALIGIVGAYYFGTQRGNVVSSAIQAPNSFSTNTPIQVTPTSKPSADPTANWKIYTNKEFKFSLRYPDSWKDVTDPRTVEAGNREFILQTSNGEVVMGTVFEGLDKSADMIWANTLPLLNNNSVKISYLRCAGAECAPGTKDQATYTQILTTLKLTQ